MPKILDGAAIAAQIKSEVADEVARLAAQGVRPGLAAVLVGHVPASEIYVRSKVQTCAELGLFSDLITPPDTVTTEDLFDVVAVSAGVRGTQIVLSPGDYVRATKAKIGAITKPKAA